MRGGAAPSLHAIAHVWIPLCVLAAANVWLILGRGDLWLTDRLYALQGGQWALRDAALTTSVLHAGGRNLSVLAWLVVTALALRASLGRHRTELRKPLQYLALSVLTSTTLVTVLKHVTRLDCPWDTVAYGGTHPYVGLFDVRPEGMHASGCFPAGHASAGYAWLALYFFFAHVRPQWRMHGLAIGLGSGLVFGITQQLRGAHYLSHDIWTLALCWFVSLGLARWWLPPVRTPLHAIAAGDAS